MMNARFFSSGILRAVVLAGLFLAGFGVAFGQTVTKYTGAASPLPDRWKWAGDEAGRQGYKSYWVGYSIERMMGERSFIGSYHSDERRNHPSLHELITGMKMEKTPGGMEGFTGSMSGNVTIRDGDKPARKVKKEVGFLFHVTGDRTGPIDEMKVSNLSVNVNFGAQPLIWLGGAEADESVSFLATRFGEVSSGDAKKHFLMGVGIHKETKRAMEFLKEVLQGSGDNDLRGDAAFWLGQTETDDARKTLTETAMKDASEEVREKAIFALSQMDAETALDDLILIARKHEDRDTRKHAAFWLGQHASEKAVGALKDLTYKDEDTEVQRSAMFALTQIRDGGGVDELIRIARTHPNPKIRKDAIFWLGESEDPKALEALVGMVKGR